MEKGHSHDGTSPGAYPTKTLRPPKTWGWITLKWCDVKVGQVIVPYDTAVIKEPAVPPAVSLSSKAER